MSTPADWYPDPGNAALLRYWDGARWTDHTAPRNQPNSVSQPPAASAPTPSARKVPLFGARQAAKDAHGEADALRAQLHALGGLDAADLAIERDKLRDEVSSLRAEVASLQQAVVLTQEAAILQEVGLYEYRHPLADSLKYKDELASLTAAIKMMLKKDGGAIQSATDWQVNGSAAQGRKMIADMSKLMLRAYNAEADNLVRGMKPYKLDAGLDRLEKVAFAIERLGKMMSIRVAPDYHYLRRRELERVCCTDR